MFGTEIPIAILFLVLLLFVPESPRWQVVNGQEEVASASIAFFDTQAFWPLGGLGVIEL